MFDCDELLTEAIALRNRGATTLDHYCSNGEHKKASA